MTFIIATFQSRCKIEHNQVKWNKITRELCKSDSIFFIYKVVHCLNDFFSMLNINTFTMDVILKIKMN